MLAMPVPLILKPEYQNEQPQLWRQVTFSVSRNRLSLKRFWQRKRHFIKIACFLVGFVVMVAVVYLNLKHSLTLPRKRLRNLRLRDILKGPALKLAADVYKYPLNVDMLALVDKVRQGKPADVSEINPVKYRFTVPNEYRCSSRSKGNYSDFEQNSLHLLIIVKSAVENFEQRKSIRQTWTRAEAWPGFKIQYFFNIGQPDPTDKLKCANMSWRLEFESLENEDIVQRDFVDHYYNNTHKMMSGIDWAEKYCKQADYYLFVDDDFYVNPLNIMKHLRTVSTSLYPRYFLGYNYPYGQPVRVNDPKKERSKWYVSPSEYPFELYPSYVAAGFFIVSNPVLFDVAIAMKYTKYLRFDDVFLGLVLRKLLLVPLHHSGIADDINRIPKDIYGCRTRLHKMLAVHIGKKYSVSMITKIWLFVERYQKQIRAARKMRRQQREKQNSNRTKTKKSIVSDLTPVAATTTSD